MGLGSGKFGSRSAEEVAVELGRQRLLVFGGWVVILALVSLAEDYQSSLAQLV